MKPLKGRFLSNIIRWIFVAPFRAQKNYRNLYLLHFQQRSHLAHQIAPFYCLLIAFAKAQKQI